MAAIFEFESHDVGIPQRTEDVGIDLSGSSKLHSSDVSSRQPKHIVPASTLGPNLGGLGSLSATLRNTRISSKQGPAKGGLAFLIANSNSSSRAPSDAGDLAVERATEFGPRSAKKKKNKKRGKKGNNVSTAGLEKPDFMAQNVPQKLPLANGVPIRAAEPDWSFMKIPTASSSSSRSSSPARSGLSSLLSQAHPGDIVSVIGSDTSNSEHGDSESLVAYEVALDEDYVNKEVDSRPTTRSGSPVGLPRKKMTAADFEPLKCLGKGSYGTVILVRHKATGRLYAQKQLKKASLVVHKKIVEQTKTERAILESVRHPFVVKLYYAFQDQEKLYLILEYAEGGELFLHLAESRMFSEDAAAFYLAQLVLAVSHLHMNVGVVYRDLKPENCLLDADGQLLLTDFGLSKVRTDDSRCCSLLGTPEYMAPEVLIGDGEAEYGPEVDWWATGVIACELLTGGPPFKGNTAEKVKQRIVKSSKLSLPFYLSAEAKDLITKLLRKEPHKRLGHNMPEDLQIMKKHRFFRKIDWAKLERRELDPPIKPLVTDPELAENFSGEFTMLPLSPTINEGGFAAYMEAGQDGGELSDDLFGGFSYVASNSVLERSFLNGDW